MHRMTAVALLCCCCLLAPGAIFADELSDLRRASSLVKRGEKALESGDLEKAGKLFSDALEAAPVLPEAHMGLGHVAMRQGRFEDAAREYKSAVDAYAEAGDVIMAREQKRYADAQRQIRSLEDEISAINNPQVKVSEATRRERTMRLEQAIQELRAMPVPDGDVVVEPPAELHFHLGNALFRLQRNDEALASWEACAARDPDFALVYNNLAVAYMMRGRYQEAWQSVRRAEELGVKVSERFKRDLKARSEAAPKNPQE